MFKLDAGAARAADSKSAYISEAGKYLGTFIRAEWMEKSATGSTGLGLTFKSNDGAEAQFYINLSYQHGTKNDGGHAMLNALMACLRLREIPDPTTITVEKWDKDAGQRVQSQVPGFPVLMGKPVGILVQMEIEKNSEKGEPRPTLYAVFEAATEKTATEVLDGEKCKQPERLAKMVELLVSKPLIDRRPRGSGNVPAPVSRGNAPEPRPAYANELDDDVPF
ncbi:MAG TPA: hypothetical protein VJ652_16430 [Noviherbaspirillum sp.]|nr:hypothetical protein [Noviherbaspirillum sp.]